MPIAITDEKSIQGKKRQRLYEPLVLLKALSLDYERGFSTDLWNSEPASGPQSPKDRYHAFVYRLAYACTSDKGRNTISSVAVMEDEDSYLFIFACNQISSEEGERVSEHIKSLLRKVSAAGRSQAWPTEKRQDDVLKQILLFNRYRIEVYLKRIVSFATTYLEGYQDGRDEDSTMAASLRGLSSSLCVTTLSDEMDDEYIETCLGCLRKAKQFVKAYKTVRSDGQKDVVGSSDESWLELKHCVSRMLAYEEATKSLSNAGKTWPQLFDKFKVCHIPSSKPGSTPLGKASHSAEAIIGRMSSDQAIMDTFHEYAEEMRMFDLDDRIREECTRTSFKPIIHSEILVQDWISRQGQNHYLRFFNGWRYIGSSKPPCRMCKYYFEACGSDITLRESHRNIYPNWGFPNAHGPEGSPAAKRWQKSLNRMMDRIRQDAFKVIIEKCSESKRHDSITYDFHSEWSSRPSQPSVRSFRAESVAADDGSESDIAELGDLLRDGLTLTTHGGDHSDDEEDGGGALL